MTAQGPFHKGELEAQHRAGESAEAERNSPMIGNRIMAGVLGFVRQQPMVVISAAMQRENYGRRSLRRTWLPRSVA
jgi:hypothetical protein